MTSSIFPPKDSRSYHLLVALLRGPGTFYQACERAGFDIEGPAAEEGLRRIFDHLIGGNVCFDGKFYRLTNEARRTLDASQSAPYVGQVVGPAFRGTHAPRTVHISRRAPMELTR